MNAPKRKYTVTEKALAANRRNLILARAVDPKIRFRVTQKKLDACRANLTKALATLRAASLTPDGYPQDKAETRPVLSEANANQKLENGNSKIETLQSQIPNQKSQISFPDSPSYGTGFTRGLYAVSLRRSARLAGETSAGFDAHVGLFIQALGPRSPREQRLARGIAQAVWRRLRVYRGQARWERASLIYRLREAARGPAAQAWADDGLTPIGLACDLGWEIERIFSTDGHLFEAADKLNARLERLSRLWVVGRGGDPRLFEDGAPGRIRDGLLAGRSPASMGNPFLRPGQVAALMKRREASELRRFATSPRSTGILPVPLITARGPFWADFENASTRYGLMLDLCRETAEGPGSGVGCREPVEAAVAGVARDHDAETLAEFEELLAHAWEGIDCNSHTRNSVAVSGYTPGEDQSETRHVLSEANAKQKSENAHSTIDNGNAKIETPSLRSQITNHKTCPERSEGSPIAAPPPIANPQSQISNQPSSIGNRQSAIHPFEPRHPNPETRLSETLWSRLQLYADLAAREAAEVKLLLATKITGQMRDELAARLGAVPKLEAGRDGDTSAFLMELVLLFNRASSVVDEAQAARQPLGAVLHDFLVARFGACADFDYFKPGYVEAVIKAQNERRRKAIEQRLAKDDELEARLASDSAFAAGWAKSESPGGRLDRAERHFKDITHQYYMRRADECSAATSVDRGLFVDPVPSLASRLAGKPDDPQWHPRYLAAVGSRMLPPCGWKFDSPPRRRARVGLSVKRLKDKG